jgi:hypothetical protein
MNLQTHNHEARRNMLAKEIEEILRWRFGWNEVVMSNIMWKFFGVENINEYYNYGIDLHGWLQSFELGEPLDEYVFGAMSGDLYVRKWRRQYEVEVATSNPIGVFYFLKLMKMISNDDLTIRFVRQANKYVEVSYYAFLRQWPWPSLEETSWLETIKDFDANKLAKYIGGLIDSDGSVSIYFTKQNSIDFKIRIYACRICVGFLRAVRDTIYDTLGIKGTVSVNNAGDSSELYYRNKQGVKLLNYVLQYLRHPLRRIRAELYLRYYDKELSREELQRLYVPLKYDDLKRNHAVDAFVQGASQTHTHGEHALILKGSLFPITNKTTNTTHKEKPKNTQHHKTMPR